MNKSLFSEYARYYDLFYKDKDYNAEADYIDKLLRRHKPETRTVLELGSGTGKHAVLLAERGYQIHGIERSEDMLAQAQSLVRSEKWKHTQIPAPVFSQGDIRTARAGRMFDAVISLFHVISYQATNADLVAAFRTARAHLCSGGIFIFDTWYGPAVLTDRPVVRIKRMSDEDTEVTRIAEPVMFPNDNLVEVNYHVFIRNRQNGNFSELQEKHLMRYLFLSEITQYADNSEFSIVHCEEWLTGRTLDFGTWGACFVLQAK